MKTKQIRINERIETHLSGGVDSRDNGSEIPLNCVSFFLLSSTTVLGTLNI